MSYAVHIKEVVKRYGDFHAVNHITLSIENGEFFTLLGPSGCGKTTLLRMIAGFNSIDGGTISFNDRVVNDIPANYRNIGMVFQNYAVFPHMSVAENVAYGLKARKVKGEELKRRVREGLSIMRIENLAERMPSQLSGGQQQRVALARAIVIEPDVMLMDEPLSNLDAKLRLEMRAVIRGIQQKLGITTIYVTHDQEEALAISDRIAVLDSGTVRQVGSPESIYNHPDNAFVANFIGTSNFLRGTLQGGELDIHGYVMPFVPRQPYEGAVRLSVRPEQIELIPAQGAPLCGKVLRDVFLGNHHEYEIEVSDGTSVQVNTYHTPDGMEIREGETVGLQLSERHVTVYDESGEVALS
ncbi:ABC transporter ATP-binding protein [Selenomonas sp. TAMA-11512]|uniref:ABC transporter ATP-binding protein n=1 Tax=Selenomonas sp. TAMA-11512 TaxID=3095337 RepID=UPI00308A17E3|nr:ABC transporter ATP-binding protein [Selenomonas sp. TAMA-11512]